MTFKNTPIVMLSFFLFAGMDTAFAETSNASSYLSPLSITANKTGRLLFTAGYTGCKISLFDIQSETVLDEIALPDPPSGLALSPDETLLYVTGDSPNGKVHIIDLTKNRIIQSIWVGHSPCAPAVSNDGNTLYVCNRFSNTVSVCDLKTGIETARIAVEREPTDAVLTPDGQYLFVLNHIHSTRADADYVAANVSIINTNAGKVVSTITLPNGSIGVQQICLSPDGHYAYITHVLARYQLPTTQLERGWINTNAISIIDAEKQTYYNTVLLDSVDLGAANPWGICCPDDGKHLYAAHAGTHEISMIDRIALHEKLAKADAGIRVSDPTYSAEDVPNDLSFLSSLRKRIRLQGKGPRGITAIGTKIYTTEYYSDSLGIIDTAQPDYIKTRSIALQEPIPITLKRKGEMLFHDANYCFQKWQSCASCHPGNGRADGLNWDLLNDGIGNPKNAKSLLLAHLTPPSMISGVRDSAETAVRAGFRYIQFFQCADEDATAVDEYLKSLTPVPSPRLKNGKLNKAALRGKKVYEKANCNSCHPAPLYTNLQTYNVGTGLQDRPGRDLEFDTPTLIETWRTAPYLHDGRAVTIEEVLTKYNANDSHGVTSNLTPQEISDLAEYILSL